MRPYVTQLSLQSEEAHTWDFNLADTVCVLRKILSRLLLKPNHHHHHPQLKNRLYQIHSAAVTATLEPAEGKSSSLLSSVSCSSGLMARWVSFRKDCNVFLFAHIPFIFPCYTPQWFEKTTRDTYTAATTHRFRFRSRTHFSFNIKSLFLLLSGSWNVFTAAGGLRVANNIETKQFTERSNTRAEKRRTGTKASVWCKSPGAGPEGLSHKVQIPPHHGWSVSTSPGTPGPQRLVLMTDNNDEFHTQGSTKHPKLLRIQKQNLKNDHRWGEMVKKGNYRHRTTTMMKKPPVTGRGHRSQTPASLSEGGSHDAADFITTVCCKHWIITLFSAALI